MSRIQHQSWRAFTLVELLVVIGIIALLISILLPALGKARESANSVKCASNLRTIGQGIATYVAENRGTLPPSNYYKGLGFVNGQQVPTTPDQGFVHWSSFLYKDKTKLGTDEPFLNETGWDAFKCPSLDRGGLAPANTYASNRDGFDNEIAGSNVIDWQAPRNAYTLNEALCPRGIFGPLAPRGNLRNYKFVQASRVKNSAQTILATELSGVQNLVRSISLIDNATPVSGSRRPVSGYDGTGGGGAIDEPYKLPYRASFVRTSLSEIGKDPERNAGATVQTLLDYVGRNHGKKKLDGKGYDIRLTNFLYLDGHVETKSVLDTVRSTFEWGERFYTLER